MLSEIKELTRAHQFGMGKAVIEAQLLTPETNFTCKHETILTMDWINVRPLTQGSVIIRI